MTFFFLVLSWFSYKNVDIFALEIPSWLHVWDTWILKIILIADLLEHVIIHVWKECYMMEDRMKFGSWAFSLWDTYAVSRRDSQSVGAVVLPQWRAFSLMLTVPA